MHRDYFIIIASHPWQDIDDLQPIFSFLCLELSFQACSMWASANASFPYLTERIQTYGVLNIDTDDY